MSHCTILAIVIAISLIHSSCSKTVYVEFDVRYFTGAPNGVQKSILGVNNKFPGPTIRATIGDVLIVNVTNNIQTKENTSIHWHGLEQYQTPFEDGPEYVTQCPIIYGTFQVYQFQLKQAGTYWWHSHHSWQYTAGYWGALIIKNNPEIYGNMYSDELVLSLSDWYNAPTSDISTWYLSKASEGNPPIPDSVLINGKGFYPCPVAAVRNLTCNTARQRYLVFEVSRGKTYRLRVINTAAMIFTKFSMDDHKLRAVEVDGVDTVLGKPVDSATLAPAQRYSFLVTMNGNRNRREYWIRVGAVGVPMLFPNFNQDPSAFNPNVLAILRYKVDNSIDEVTSIQDPQVTVAANAVQGRPENRLENKFSTFSRLNDTQLGILSKFYQNQNSFKTIPAFSGLQPKASSATIQNPTTQPPASPKELIESTCKPFGNGVTASTAPNFFSQEFTLVAALKNYTRGVMRWSFNDNIYKMSKNAEPALYQVLKSKRVSVGFNPIYTTFGRGKVIQIIINNHGEGRHPFHLHGHSFWVVGEGLAGDNDYNVSRDLNKLRLDGVRRDTLTVPGLSWIVIRYYADNPGTWLFHCHINWHLQAGLGLVFVEGSDAIRSFTRLPTEWLNVCKKTGINVAGLYTN